MMVRRTRLSRGNGSKRRDRLKHVSPGGEAGESAYVPSVEKEGGEGAMAGEASEPKVSHEQDDSIEKLPSEEGKEPKVSYGFDDAEISAAVQSDTKELAKDSPHFDLTKTFKEIKADVTKGYAELQEKGGKAAKELGGFMHEMIYLDDDEAQLHGKNIEVARRLMAEHPDENILLKAQLFDEPADSAGLIGYVRAEDYLNFDEIEIAMPDGSTYTIPRRNIRDFIGISSHAAEINLPKTATTSGALGTDEFSGVDEDAEEPSFHDELKD